MKRTEEEKAIDLLFVVIEKICWNLNKTMGTKRTTGMNKKASFSIDELKEKVKLEDIFYEIILKNIAIKTDTKISFCGDRVLFEKK